MRYFFLSKGIGQLEGSTLREVLFERAIMTVNKLEFVGLSAQDNLLFSS